MKYSRKILLASAAVMALGLGIPSDARAFDDTDWNWSVDVDKNITENVNINVDINPSGMATIENLQENIGNVTSTATIDNFTNSPPGIGEDGFVTIDETITVTSNFDKPVGVGNSVPNSGGGVNDDGDSPLTSTYLGGSLSEQANGFTAINDVNLTGQIALENVEGVNSAFDLPKIENAATSVGNNFSLESEVALNLNSGQLNYGGFNVPDPDFTQGQNPIVDQAQYLGQTYNSVDNAHVGKVYSAGLAAALGIITQGEVTATASVGNLGPQSILNATVENSATAVGNNFSVALNAITSDDASMVADNTQFNYANTTSTATVNDVYLDSYADLGAAGFGPCGGCQVDGVNVGDQIPVISNVATSVGNNASIKITSPSLDL